MIRVQLLGRFRMYDETRCLNEEAIHSPMITKLLVYMICNKNHIVTLEQLTEALWTDEESENPYGALKNMMYRLRGTLRKVCTAERKGKVQVLSDLKELYQEPRELEKIN